MRHPVLTAVLLACAVAVSARANSVTARTVFVSVVDKAGPFIGDLTPADFAVKEGGKLRDVISVEPATGATKIAMLFEEGLIRDSDVRLAVLRLIQRMQDHAEMSVVVAGLSNTTVVPYTADGAALVVGMNGLLRGPHPLGGGTVDNLLKPENNWVMVDGKNVTVKDEKGMSSTSSIRC